MACFNPLKGFRARKPGKNGKYGIVFNPRDGFVDQPVSVPCGQCSGCRLEHSRMWAVRCVHEAQQYEDNSFLTLTYDEEHLPSDNSISIEALQLFFKRLRKRLGSTKIRYFACGEYGEDNSRAHYHVCLFNYDFPDKILYGRSRNHRIYTSELLDSAWSNQGLCFIGSLTFESCAYVARYVMKKLTGPRASEYGDRKPPFVTMSRRPGIGSAHFEKYNKEIYKDDMIIINGKKHRVPRFYDKRLELQDAELLKNVKISRQARADAHADNNTYERLRVREKIQKIKTDKLIRSI